MFKYKYIYIYIHIYIYIITLSYFLISLNFFNYNSGRIYFDKGALLLKYLKN